MDITQHRAHVSPVRRFLQGCSIGAALVVGALLLTIGVLALQMLVPHEPDLAECTTDLVQVGLTNMTNDAPATGQGRPSSCAGLTEEQYAQARHEAAVRIAAVLAGH